MADQIWQVKYSRQPLSQNSIYNPRTQYFLLNLLALALACRLLNQQDTKKATGLDRIPFELLKRFSSIVGPSLAYIFKSCIDAEIFPNEWKISKVTPLFKKGSKRDMVSHVHSSATRERGNLDFCRS